MPALEAALGRAVTFVERPDRGMIDAAPEGAVIRQMRRVGHDINAVWLSVMSLIDLAAGLWPFAHPGQPKGGDAFFNELEMMEVGNGDFIAEQGQEALDRTRA